MISCKSGQLNRVVFELLHLDSIYGVIFSKNLDISSDIFIIFSHVCIYINAQ